MTNINSNSIKSAHKRIKKYILETPLITNIKINKKYGSQIYFKLENKQKTGSFKVRGAFNKLLQLKDGEKKKGIVAYSSGNHGQAVSYASKILGIDSIVVMPSDAPKIKLKNTKKHGAKLVLFNRFIEDREKIAMDIAKKSGRILIRPFNDEDIIIGQGTAGLEIKTKLKEKKIIPDIFLCCCSGGGLIAGTSSYLKYFYPQLSVYSVEPQYYDDMRMSINRGKLVSINPKRKTICDALTVKKAGNLTFKINKKILKKGLVVTDSEVKKAIRFLKNKIGIISEPGGAAPTAAFLSKSHDFYGKVVVVMVSGGNIDKTFFKKILNYD